MRLMENLPLAFPSRAPRPRQRLGGAAAWCMIVADMHRRRRCLRAECRCNRDVTLCYSQAQGCMQNFKLTSDAGRWTVYIHWTAVRGTTRARDPNMKVPYAIEALGADAAIDEGDVAVKHEAQAARLS